MRLLFLLMLSLGCGTPASAPATTAADSCWSTCHDRCTAEVRSELRPCASECSKACSCGGLASACECAWRRSLYGAPVPPECRTPVALDAGLGLDPIELIRGPDTTE